MKNVITKTLVASAISTAMLAGAVQADVTLVSWGGGYSASQLKPTLILIQVETLT